MRLVVQNVFTSLKKNSLLTYVFTTVKKFGVGNIFWSHFILSGFKYYVLVSKNKYNVLIVFMGDCKKLLLLLRCDMVRDRCGGLGRFKGGLRCNERVSCYRGVKLHLKGSNCINKL